MAAVFVTLCYLFWRLAFSSAVASYQLLPSPNSHPFHSHRNHSTVVSQIATHGPKMAPLHFYLSGCKSHLMVDDPNLTRGHVHSQSGSMFVEARCKGLHHQG
jgi:hypothetical protein